jgi:hypothetical protein
MAMEMELQAAVPVTPRPAWALRAAVTRAALTREAATGATLTREAA